MKPFIRLTAARRWWLIAAVLVAWSVPVAVRADETSGPAISTACAPNDVWLVSCRRFVCFTNCTLGDPAQLAYWRYDSDCRKWLRADYQQFLAATTVPMPTTVWVHGDRVDSSEAFQIGMEVYRQLTCDNSRGSPMRFVIWSWPSDKERFGKPLKDARTKAARSDVAGYWLAALLAQSDPEMPVSVMGFSFGARAVTAALHVLAGGAVNGYALPVADNNLGPHGYRIILMAAALDSNWLDPDRRYGMAWDCIQEMLLLNNSRDWVLKRYHRLKCGNGCNALGYTGLHLSHELAAFGDAVCQVNAGPFIGKQHRWDGYICNANVMAKIRGFALCNPHAGIVPATAPRSAGELAEVPSATDVASDPS